MKKLASPIVLLILSITLTFSLTSCKSTVEPELDDTLAIVSDGVSEYVIIRTDASSDSEISASVALKRAFSENCGATLKLAAMPQSGEAPERSIVLKISKSDPTTDKAFDALDYSLHVQDKKLIIAATNGDSLASAVAYFADNVLTSQNVTLPYDYLYRYNHTYTSITVGGVSLSSFGINRGDGDEADAEALADAIAKATGQMLEIRDDSEFRTVTMRIDPEAESGKMCVARVGETLTLTCPSKLGLKSALKSLADNLSRYNRLAFDANFRLTFDYAAPLITEGSFENCYFVCETDKNPLEYKSGEEMCFTLTLKADGETVGAPKINYTVEKDFNGEKLTETVDGSSGVITIKTSMNEPGFVRVYAAPCSEAGTEYKGVIPFNGGAGADVEVLRQIHEEPADFDEFWSAELAKLYATEPEVTIVKDLSENYDGYKVYDVRINCVGDPVSGYISYPENAEPGSLNILIGFQGYGTYSIVPELRTNSIVMVVNAHSIENDRERGYYTELAYGSLASYGFNKTENLNRDKVYFKNMILRDVQALRYLKTLPEWNGTNISLNGGSQGGFQSLAVAALDPDVTYLYIGQPWLCDLGGSEAGRLSSWQPDYTDALRYYDTINFAKRVRCMVTADAGLGDSACPPAGILSLYNEMTAPRQFNIYQNRTHNDTAPEAECFVLRSFE